MAETLYHPDDPTLSAEVTYGDGFAVLRYSDGTEVTLPGFGSMRNVPLNLDPRIDLTKPIWEQATKLWEHDREHENNDQSGEAA